MSTRYDLVSVKRLVGAAARSFPQEELGGDHALRTTAGYRAPGLADLRRFGTEPELTSSSQAGAATVMSKTGGFPMVGSPVDARSHGNSRQHVRVNMNFEGERKW